MLLLLFALAGIDGAWHAAVKYPTGERVPFSLELSRHANGWRGSLVNGEDRVLSALGSFDGKTLRLPFPEWDGVLEATLQSNQRWQGTFTRQRGKQILMRPLEAARDPLLVPRTKAGVDVSGEWILEVDNNGKAQVWRAVFEQQGGGRLRSTLRPVSGDSGLLLGFVEGDTLLAGRFDGIRASLVEARLDAGGALVGKIDGTMPFRGRRAAESVVHPPDADRYTRMKNAAEPFRIPVAGDWEQQLKGKVVLVSIMGSWCPNCHEEMPLLLELYQRYRSQGFEIVSLGFEYTGERERDERMLRMYREKYKIPWPVLYAGSTEDAPGILGQLENFGAYPTTVFVGRDGLVKAVHAGFDGPSTGARHEELKQQVRALVEKLVVEK